MADRSSTYRLDAVAHALDVRGVSEPAHTRVQVPFFGDDQRGAVGALHRVRHRAVASDVTLKRTGSVTSCRTPQLEATVTQWNKNYMTLK